MIKKYFLKIVILSTVFLSLSIVGCVKNNATGERQLVILSETEENNIGAKEHPKIIENFGGVYSDKNLQNYITNIGHKIVLDSDIARKRWMFTILDSPIVNAFALPGGYVYVTRGLLSLANDEAEIASVIGHEIGHVTARHSAQRHAKSSLSNIGLDLLSLAIGKPIITNLASIGVQGVMAAFSRSEELEADKLGIQYIIKSRYDPEGSLRFLNRLDQLTKISSKSQQNAISSLFSTHPKTKARIDFSKDSFPKNLEYLNYKEDYLSAIDNMVYGDNSSQGVIKNNQFFHVDLDFTFITPHNYKIINNDTFIIIQKENKDEIIIFDGLKRQQGITLLETAEAIYNRSEIKSYVELYIDEQSAIHFDEKTLIKYDNRDYLRRTYLINWPNNRIWRFSLLINPLNKEITYEVGSNIANSLHKLTEEEKIKGRPKYIKIIKTKLNETPLSLSNKMSIKENKLEMFCILNGLDLCDSSVILPEGLLVKMIKDY
jgi:predicted Zn-dependent protease